MSSQKPSIPKGTRDFAPAEMVRRNYIFDTIRGIFRVFGYQPIETPATENLSTLMGKYGEEGDKLLFRILNSGDYLQGLQNPEEKVQNYRELTPLIAEKGLRYDLTVPFARFVVQHQSELVFPFKRYQIQPVWRADRPQKGRYREFFQCDVDVIGSRSLLYEVELVQIIDAVFSKLGLAVEIHINHRKILTALAAVIGQPQNFTRIITALDKLDKIGKEGVIGELRKDGIEEISISKMMAILVQAEHDDNMERLKMLEGSIGLNSSGAEGIADMQAVFSYLDALPVRSKVTFDLSLARGLSYYTGTIFEVKALDAAMGSICGGGRYDDLTGIFGLPGMSGVGISFGADRIYDVMNELNLFPGTIQAATRALFLNFGPEEEKFSLNLLSGLRSAGVPAEIYPEPSKIKKQMEYANRKGIPFVILIGKEEMEKGMVQVKNMQTGEQKSCTAEELSTMIS